jgi:hypothetical protein
VASDSGSEPAIFQKAQRSEGVAKRMPARLAPTLQNELAFN